MKRLITIICLILQLNTAATASDVFRMKASAGTSLETVNIEKQFEKNESFSPFFSKAAITGLSITGSFEKTSDEYLVRVLLKDVKGREYLVMESYEEICDKSSQVFTDYCEETIILEGIVPDSIKVFVRDATVKIESISCQYTPQDNILRGAAFNAAKKESRKRQVEEAVRRINEHNISHNKLWRAGVTDLSLKDYDIRKKLTGFAENMSSGGYEYYEYGIFEIGKPSGHRSSSSNTDFTDFDWMDNHGNWIPHFSTQNGPTCMGYAAVACLEAMYNIYYMDQDTMDLSEKDLICQCGDPSPEIVGFKPVDIVNCLLGLGINKESDHPYSMPCPDEPLATDRIKFTSYETFSKSEDILKQVLREKGPFISGWSTGNWEDNINVNPGGHAILMIGYGTIHYGMTLREIYNGSGSGHGTDIIITDPNDDRIGRLFWKCRDSHSLSPRYYLINNSSYMATPVMGIGPKYMIYDSSTHTYTEKEVAILNNTDYYWSNIYNKIRVKNGATFEIKNDVQMSEDSKIIVENGGHLIINGKILDNADIQMLSGSQIDIINGGVIRMRANKAFDAPLGATVNVNNGRIE